MIRFEGSREEFELVVEASSAPVSVFPAETCTDLRCCVVGKLYVKKVSNGTDTNTQPLPFGTRCRCDRLGYSKDIHWVPLLVSSTSGELGLPPVSAVVYQYFDN